MMTEMTRTQTLAVALVAALIILIASAGGVLLKFYEAREEAAESSAALDGTSSSGQFPVYSETENLYARWFTEPFERVVFLFKDGTKRSFTTQEAYRVDIGAAGYVEQFRREKRDIADIVLCVHNHFSGMGFADGDRSVWRYLKRHGFTGKFLIYQTSTGRVRDIEEER